MSSNRDSAPLHSSAGAGPESGGDEQADAQGQQPGRPADVGEWDQDADQLPAAHLKRADELERAEHEQWRQDQPDDPEQRVQQVGLDEGDAPWGARSRSSGSADM